MKVASLACFAINPFLVFTTWPALAFESLAFNTFLRQFFVTFATLGHSAHPKKHDGRRLQPSSATDASGVKSVTLLYSTGGKKEIYI